MTTRSVIQPFATLADPQRAHWFFQRHLPAFAASTRRIEACRIVNCTFKPHRKPKHRAFFPCYVLAVSDTVQRTSGSQILYCQAYTNGRSAAQWEQAARTPLVPPRYADSLVHVADFDLLVWGFPNDPHLPHLPRVFARDHLREHWSTLVPDGYHRRPIITMTVVNYRPELRCTTRCTLMDAASLAHSPLMVYGKTFSASVGPLLARRLWALWTLSRTQPECPTVPEPLGYAQDCHTLWMKPVEGTPLPQLVDSQEGIRHLRTAAQALVRFRQFHIPGLPHRSIVHRYHEAREKLDKLETALPHLGPRIERVRSALDDPSPQTFPDPRIPIHGDLHLDHILIGRDTVAFVDFDEMALGDPLQDLAQFLIDLHFHNWDPAFVEHLGFQAYQEYERHAGEKLCLSRLRWQLQVQFLNKAYRFFTKHRPGCAKPVAAILDMALRPVLGTHRQIS